MAYTVYYNKPLMQVSWCWVYFLLFVFSVTAYSVL